VKKLLPLMLVTMFTAARADAQYAAPDPAGSGPILGAVDWLQGTLLGNVAG
jgi:type IV secretion system protein VirB2